MLETIVAGTTYAIASCVALVTTDPTTILGLTISYNAMVHFREMEALCYNWCMIHQLEHVVLMTPMRVQQQKPVVVRQHVWEPRVDLGARLGSWSGA